MVWQAWIRAGTDPDALGDFFGMSADERNVRARMMQELPGGPSQTEAAAKGRAAKAKRRARDIQLGLARRPAAARLRVVARKPAAPLGRRQDWSS